MAVAVEQPTKFTFPTLFSKFYGSALPRPYVFDSENARLNPPSANGALLEWAASAHWNMGGLNDKRTKLQGKIEGKLDKLDKEQKKRSSSSGKKGGSSAKRRRHSEDSDEEDEKVLEEMETENESEGGERDSEDEESDLDLEEDGVESEEEEAEEDKPSHIRSRTRSGSKEALAKRVAKVLEYGEAEARVNESAKAESLGPAPAVPAGSGRTRQLRKRIAATPRTSVSTRSAEKVRTPSSARSDAKGPARRSGRTPPVALPSPSSGESEEETEDDEPDKALSDSSEDERSGNENQYPATDGEDEWET